MIQKTPLVQKDFNKDSDKDFDENFRNLLLSFMPHELGVYIHFPWCLQKCFYCDFFSLELKGPRHNNILYEKYICSLQKEFHLRMAKNSSFAGFQKITSVFFGGGTPSLMPAELLHSILSMLKAELDFSPDCEISLEGNPEDMNQDYLCSLHQIGINRVNVGIQTFRPSFFHAMNRFYSEERYQSILCDLKNSPFLNFGADLMCGFPGQKIEDFFEDLERLLTANPSHLSIYGLTIEEGTPYHSHVKQIGFPEEELQRTVLKELPSFLLQHGKEEKALKQYEISHFAQTRFPCRHNIRYWVYEPYLGLGPGAHGFDGFYRYANPKSIGLWEETLEQAIRANETTKETSRGIPHCPPSDVPILLLRICGKVPLSIWKKVLLENCRLPISSWQTAREIFQKWEKRGLAVLEAQDSGEHYAEKQAISISRARSEKEYKERFFQWKPEGIQVLDDCVFEMYSALRRSS